MIAEKPSALPAERLRDRRVWHPLAFVAGAVVVLALYLYGTVVQATVVNHGGTDQEAYLEYTRALYEDPLYIDGNRMPLFPFIVRLFYQPQMSDAQLFELGKAVGIGVSLVGLAATTLIFYRAFPALLATVIVLIATFTVFVFKAPYFQAEVLFYFLYFGAFVLMCRAFRRLTPGLALATGALLGLAMLAKASAATTLVLFAAAMLGQTAVNAVRERNNLRQERVLRPLAGVLLVGLVFALLLSGYMASSRRIFGPLFYNVNTTFYMWYDSWDEVRAGTRAHGDRVGWPAMPDDELPSLSRYLAEHRPRELVNRVRDGLRVQYLKHCTYAYDYAFGYCNYVAAFGVAALVVTALNLPVMFRALRRNVFLVLFCGGFFVLHILLTAWWTPISPGRRFMLGMLLPLLYAFASILTVPGLRRLSLRVGGVRLDLRTLLLSAMLVAIAVDTYHTLDSRVYWMYGGD